MKVSMRKRVSSKNKKKHFKLMVGTGPCKFVVLRFVNFKKLKSYFHVSSSCVTSPQYSYLSWNANSERKYRQLSVPMTAARSYDH